MTENPSTKSSNIQIFIDQVLKDFRICCISRETSFLGRKEVLRGKAKFGILGDGKELPQIAMARFFKKGDFRSGYYRDQTFMMAKDMCTVEDFFAQLYADVENDPYSGGRQMNSHFATELVDKDGNWTEHKNRFNVTSDISPTGGQMARAVGVALASKLYRNTPELGENNFSTNGDEISFCTIGDASTSEGVFWESINAAGVQKIPLAVFVWDDGYGISVPIEYQTTKGSISELLKGYKPGKDGKGVDIYKVEAWNYPKLMETFEKGISKIRETHTPAIFHVIECTQPQGHSTSGSHERYKSQDRLNWEKEKDGLVWMENWILDKKLATQEELDKIKAEALALVKKGQKNAWDKYYNPIKKDLAKILPLIQGLAPKTNQSEAIAAIFEHLSKAISPLKFELIKACKKALRLAGKVDCQEANQLRAWLKNALDYGKQSYNTKLYSENQFAAIYAKETPAIFTEKSPIKNGYEILNRCFDINLSKHNNLFAFGEDVGDIGDVNQGFAGLQAKYGKNRVFDTGIREWTIIGQAIGMSMRGLRPIAEIQYLDYLLYGLVPLSDDMATLRYRSNGIQQAPAIIRTRGHRLEGIWHTGSPIGMILHSLRGMIVCVPRNMTQACGFYNTLLQSNDPALVIECLNGYRLKEKMPDNIGDYAIPIGRPEILMEGTDITLVTYGSCVRIAEEAIKELATLNISVELIDAQCLLPFDLEHVCAQSVKKTNRLVVLDEDVPGGASAFILQKILEEQKAYYHLDSDPQTITAAPHRSPYGSEGDYFSKPGVDHVVEKLYQMMHEVNPTQYPDLGFIQ